MWKMLLVVLCVACSVAIFWRPPTAVIHAPAAAPAPGVPAPAAAAAPAPGVGVGRRVLIISVDGLRPDVLLRAKAPNVRALMAKGSFTFWAQTVATANTLPAHATMLTGASVGKHGIQWDWSVPLAEPVYPYSPTLFELASKAGYTTAMAVGKERLALLNKPGTVDWSYVPTEWYAPDDVVADHAVDMIRKFRPKVMFVHITGVDVTGHAKGWGGPEQLAAVEDADKAIGRVLQALDDAGVRGRTLVIVTADHGGAGWNHGPDDPRSRHIPWIISGPGVWHDYDLTLKSDLTIRIADTFATACYYLDLDMPTGLEGQPVTEAFDLKALGKPAATQKQD